MFKPTRPINPRVRDVTMGTDIPKIVYQTFPTKDLPGPLASNVRYIKELNPDFQHVLFDDDDIVRFIKEEYGPDVLASYERINPKYGAARADLFRYLLIYKRGGVYLDIKSRMSQPLRQIIRSDDHFLLSKWGDYNLVLHHELAHIPRGEFQNWHVIGVQGHPFLKAVLESVLVKIDKYRPWLHGVGKNAVIRVTGPIVYTLSIYPLLERYPHRAVDSQSDLALEYATAIEGTHISLFKTHYSNLEESVVTLSGSAALFSGIYFRLRLHLLLRAMKQRILGSPAPGPVRRPTRQI